MIYLRDIISCLEEESFQTFSEAAHTATESSLIMLYRDGGQYNLSAEQVATSLEISPTTLRKLNSQLLQRAYQDVFQNDWLAIFDFLAGNELAELIQHELKKQIKSQTGPNIKNGFEAYLRVNSTKYDPKVSKILFNQISDKQLIDTIDLSICECLMLKRNLYLLDGFHNFKGAKREKLQKDYEEKIKQLELLSDSLKSSKGVELQFSILHLKSIFLESMEAGVQIHLRKCNSVL